MSRWRLAKGGGVTRTQVTQRLRPPDVNNVNRDNQRGAALALVGSWLCARVRAVFAAPLARQPLATSLWGARPL